MQKIVLIALVTISLPLVRQKAQAQTDSAARSVVLRDDAVHEEEDLSIPTASDTSYIRPVRLGIVTGTVAAAMVAIHTYQSNGWWKDNRRSFHFQEDLRYGLSVDKLGHFYGGIAAAFVLRKSFLWAGLSDEAALWWGSGGSLLFQTYVELEDGFSTWGFDRVDFATDVLGAAWPIAHYHSPFLQNFDFKFSYHPSPALNSGGGSGFKGQQHILFDDYEGQTLWMSINIHGLLPKSAKPFWPGFLNLAVGYGARDVQANNPYSVVFLALDLNMKKLIPDDTPFLKLLGETLDFIKFPAPAVRISPNAIWYGIYF